jgi:GNAT superfamily N-acetyltransferase
MFHIKKMSFEDLKFAVHITNKMSWNFVEEDFKFMIELEPEGCFVLLCDSERVGIATAVCFGKIGWFGNFIVDERHRNRGAGSMLAKHAIQFLECRNVKTIGLYSYIDKIPFYERLGFKYDSEFVVLDGKGFPQLTKPSLKKVQTENIRDIIDYDCSCFGASRKKLLEPILLSSANKCYLCVEDGEMIGYCVAKVYEDMAELGPLVCKKGRNDVAAQLLWANLNGLGGFEVSMCVPRKELAIISTLSKSRFRERFRVARMFLGLPINKDCIYVAESLERG